MKNTIMKRILIILIASLSLIYSMPSQASASGWAVSEDNIPILSDLQSSSASQKEMVINFDPIYDSVNGKKQHDLVDWWNDPHDLSNQYNDDITYSSNGNVSYTITEWHELNEMPCSVDGRSYTIKDYYTTLQAALAERGDYWNYSGWMHFGDFDYGRYLKRFDVYKKIESGEIDEVWIFMGPCDGVDAYETLMTGRNAYWCNSPGVVRSDCRAFVTYAFNFERDVGCMLEDSGHRFESIMTNVYGRWDYSTPISNMNNWEKFTLYNKISPGNAACGNVHYAPNSQSDYDWGNTNNVQSTCNDWLNYPILTGAISTVNCGEWGNGDMAAHHIWWFLHMPHMQGIDKLGVANNWWIYFKYPTIHVKPSIPAITSIASTSPTNVKIVWSAVKDANGYEIYRSKAKTGTYEKVMSAASVSVTDTNLSPGTTYYYKLRAYKAFGSIKTTGSFSAMKTVVTNTPAIPANLKATSASYNSIKLTWTAVPGAAGYEVWRAASFTGAFSLAGSSATTSFINAGLTTGTTYWFKVRAYVLVGTTRRYGAFATVVSAKPALSTPASPKAVSLIYCSIKVTWGAVAGATKYELYRSISQTGTYSLLTSTTVLSYTNGGLTTGKKYYYKVRAYRLSGSSKIYSGWSSVVYAMPVLSTPIVKATPATYNSIKVSWSAVDGATKYELYRATSSTGTYNLLTETTALGYSNTNITTGLYYYYKVRAYRLVGSTKVYGAYSAVASVRAIPAVPSSIKSSGVSYASVKVSWGAVAGATKYEVWRCTESAMGTFKMLAETALLSCMNTGLVSGKHYWYKVRVYRLAGSVRVYSGFSTIVSAGTFVQLSGLDYSPYIHKGQSPDTGSVISESQITETMGLVVPYTKWVRTYGCTGSLVVAGAIAHKIGLKIAVGAWLGRDIVANENEIASLIKIANKGEADVLIVGSETLLRGDLTESQLMQYIDRVRAATKDIPIATAETSGMFMQHPSVIGHIDCIYANIYPYWEGIGINDAINSLNNSYQLLQGKAGGKQIVISETGWPDSGSTIQNAIPTPENASKYLSSFLAWAKQNYVTYFYFEAFDEPWKGDNGPPQEAHWGIWYSNETMKPLMEKVLR